MPGPPPKRSDQRRRRNKPTDGRQIVTAPAGVKVDPPAPCEYWHPLVVEWYNSLIASGQCQFYEASDWATARLMADVLSKELEEPQPRAAIIATFNQVAGELLTTEGARRRMRIELTQSASDSRPGGMNVAMMDHYRKVLGKAASQ